MFEICSSSLVTELKTKNTSLKTKVQQQEKIIKENEEVMKKSAEIIVKLSETVIALNDRLANSGLLTDQELLNRLDENTRLTKIRVKCLEELLDYEISH